MGKNHTLEHDYIKKQLEGTEGQTFLKDFLYLSRKGNARTSFYMIMHEISINRKKNRIDTVFYLRSSLAANLQTIGIEIKGHRHDLLSDTKMYDYLGHTDYFFLAVPPVLVKPARVKAAVDPRIGLIRMSDGKILIFPEKQDVPPDFKKEVKASAMQGTHRTAFGVINATP